jgi:hypothetical protein
MGHKGSGGSATGFHLENWSLDLQVALAVKIFSDRGDNSSSIEKLGAAFFARHQVEMAVTKFRFDILETVEDVTVLLLSKRKGVECLAQRMK